MTRTTTSRWNATTTPPRIAAASVEDPEALFKEARRRERRRRLAWIGATLSVVIAGLLVYGFGFADPGSSRPHALAALRSPATTATTATTVLTCSGKPVARPATFVISCADGNSELTATRWSSWSATAAAGTTRFGLNLCNPYCAASKMTFFPDSTVRLSAPKATKHGRLFSKLVVTYQLHGKSETFPFSWSGDPSFEG